MGKKLKKRVGTKKVRVKTHEMTQSTSDKESENLSRFQVLMKDKNEYKKQVEALTHSLKELQGQKRAADKKFSEQQELLKKLDKEDKNFTAKTKKFKKQIKEYALLEKEGVTAE